MKKLVLSFLVASIMSFLGTCAIAGTETYATKAGGFTIDIPDGWKGKAVSDGCAVQTPDGANVLTVQVFPANDMSALDAAKMMAEMSSVKINSETEEDDAAFLDCDRDGIPWGILMLRDEGILVAAQFAGKERVTMKKIFETVKCK